MQRFYVYRITNTKLNKHYYGVRTTKKYPPKDDLGVKYFSSSTDKEFIEDQKLNPENYKYKVIKIFTTRKEAIKLEIHFHNKFDVGVNENFYNRAKQTSTGFDRSGLPSANLNKPMLLDQKLKISIANTGKLKSNEHKEKMSKAKKGMVSCINLSTNKKIVVTKKEFDNNDNLVGVKSGIKPTAKQNELNSIRMKNLVTCKNIITEETLQVTKEEFNNNNNLVGMNYGKKINQGWELLKCPYCKKEGKGVFKRWHFEHCKLKENK